MAELFLEAVGTDAPIAIRAYDGSSAGRTDAPVGLEVHSPRALSYLASAPGALGMARAYVTSELEVTGDLYRALHALSELTLHNLPREARLRLLARLATTRLRHPVGPPPEEHRPRGWRHSRRRDSRSISHHYDISNRFYSFVLGPAMAYTCAVYHRPDATLEDAQRAKHELVARKLGLAPGMRLLDVGCGWGGMVLHAARQGVHALGVTLSRAQAEWAQQAIAEAGLAELAEVRHLDYRDVVESDFDVVSSIGLTEHIGRAELACYFRNLYGKLRPGGRLLNHCITQPDNRADARTDAFIDRYVFPDGELLGVGRLVSVMNDNGFEVRHSENLREHYALTLAAWSANLDQRWNEAVAEVGLGRARVWRLYLAACRLGFDLNNIQLHQVLGVRLDGGRSGIPLRPDWQ